MNHSELKRRLDEALGADYAPFWSTRHVLLALGSLSVAEALESGFTPKEVWAAVWKELDLPERER